MIQELCYKVEVIPDLSLNKYSSLDGSGVEGVLEKHLAFLRQWNRKGVLSGTSIHLFYFYDGQRTDGTYADGQKGSKLKILFAVRGEERALGNVSQMVSASPLSEYFEFKPCTFAAFLTECHFMDISFSVCSSLIKKEVFVRSSLESLSADEDYYTVSPWESGEDGRLFNMCKLMEALDQQMLYRIDLYPVDRSAALRAALRGPSALLRERQYMKSGAAMQRDFEAENVLKNYDDLLNSVDASPHFIVNAFVFANDRENSAVVLDAAGAEAVSKGNYEIATFSGKFVPNAFLNNEPVDYCDPQKQIVMQRESKGLVVCKEISSHYNLKYLPTLFTLEEVAPFFRFPALYEGEVIQKRKETAPQPVSEDDGIFFGTDDNGYDVYFPLKNLSKHAFIAGVPGSGKTNTMHHLTSILWKKHDIPFLVLEPAKQEYRALLRQKGMEGVYLFSPNADMSFPLHINPFEFPKGLTVSEHIRRLCAVFEGAFPLDNPMPFLVDQAIEAVYRDLGWTPETVYTEETKLKFPTMSMLYKRLEDELKSTTYSDEIRGNLESALKVRIGSLLRREMGDVFNVPFSTIQPERWLDIPAIIELESMGTGPANFLTLMLCALIRETLKVHPKHKTDYARHVIFIEEAHNLIGPEAEEVSGTEANPKQAATAFVVKMLAEVRALKEGIVIADQLPTVMAQEVIKNTGLKIGLRITSADDRGLLGSTMAANALQMEEMATFNCGRSLISYEGLMRPFTMQTHEWCGKWSTPHCASDVFDADWCRSNCEYYRNGDCEPDGDERRKMTASPSDEELIALSRDRAVYQEICERSFVIESTRFSREYSALSRKVDDVIAHFEAMLQRNVEIKKYEARVYEENAEMMADPYWEDDIQRQQMIKDKADYVGQLKQEWKETYLDSEKYKNVYGTIVECVTLAKRIQDRKKHWYRLGITEFKSIQTAVASGAPLTERQRFAYSVNEMQRSILLSAQRLFLISAKHLPNVAKLNTALKEAASAFKAKIILP